MARAKLDLRPATPVPEKQNAAAKSARGESRLGKKLLGFFVPPATAKRLGQLALDTDQSQQALLEEALTDLFAKYKASK